MTIQVGSKVVLNQSFEGHPAGTVFTVRGIDSDGDYRLSYQGEAVRGYINPRHAKPYMEIGLDLLKSCLPANEFKVLSEMDGYSSLSINSESALAYILRGCSFNSQHIEPSPRPIAEGMKIGAIVKVTNNSNDHNYTIGEEYKIVDINSDGDCHAASSTGWRGNYLRACDCEVVATPQSHAIRIFSERTRNILSYFDGTNELRFSRKQMEAIVINCPDAIGILYRM